MIEPVVFLIDVDNTLLDNDSAQADYIAEIRNKVSANSAQRYWEIFQQATKELGYADYLGALQRYRQEDMHDPNLFSISSYFLDYDFKQRLYPKSLNVIKHLQSFGKVVILTDGDVVFQPRKILRSGLWNAVDSNVLIYIHKEDELKQIEKKYPAEHYVMIDDKIRILSAIKNQWGDRVTTIFARQGHYATDPAIIAQYPSADISIEKIGELINFKSIDSFIKKGL